MNNQKVMFSGIRDRLRPYRQALQEQYSELSFLYHRADREKKKQQLAGVDSLLGLYEFAREEFWISQIKEEIIPFLQLLRESAPVRVGEIGTYLSGNCFLFSRALARLEILIAIDLRVKNRHKLRYYAPPELAITLIDGFSGDPYTLHQVSRSLGDHQFDAVFIDGDHEYPGVRADLLAYGQMVRPGGLIAFHDIVADHFVRFGRKGPFYAGEVYLLWRQLKKRFRHWEFVADPDQNGAGIGVIECDTGTPAKLREIAQLDRHAE